MITPRHAYAGSGKAEVYFPSVPSALEGGGGQRPLPAPLYHQKRPGTRCKGGWVDGRARKNSLPPGFFS